MKISPLPSFIITLLLSFSFASAEEFVCPSADVARKAFASGAAEKWPKYSVGTAGRVQVQHPDTGLWAQAKFIGWDGQNVAICQYYNHVGLMMTSVQVGFRRGEVDGGSYWREEYVEESEDLDRSGKEMLWVCMRRADGAEYPSIGCRFESVN